MLTCHDWRVLALHRQPQKNFAKNLPGVQGQLKNRFISRSSRPLSGTLLVLLLLVLRRELPQARTHGLRVGPIAKQVALVHQAARVGPAGARGGAVTRGGRGGGGGSGRTCP